MPSSARCVWAVASHSRAQPHATQGTLSQYPCCVLFEQALGTEHRTVALTLLALGRGHLALGEPQYAEAVFREVLRVAELAWAPDALQVADACDCLAQALLAQADPTVAATTTAIYSGGSSASTPAPPAGGGGGGAATSAVSPAGPRLPTHAEGMALNTSLGTASFFSSAAGGPGPAGVPPGLESSSLTPARGMDGGAGLRPPQQQLPGVRPLGGHQQHTQGPWHAICAHLLHAADKCCFYRLSAATAVCPVINYTSQPPVSRLQFECTERQHHQPPQH